MANTKRKSIDSLRRFWHNVLEANQEQIEQDLQTLPAKDRLDVMVKITNKLLPNLASIDLSSTEGVTLRIEDTLAKMAQEEDRNN